LAQAHYQPANTVVETLQQALHCINLENMKSERMTVHTIVITPTSGLYKTMQVCFYYSLVSNLCVPSCQTWKSSGNKVFYFVCKVERIFPVKVVGTASVFLRG